MLKALQKSKKKLIILCIVVVLVVAWLLLSPLWRSKTLNEALPGVSDSLNTMDASTIKQFTEQTEAMKDDTKEARESMPAGGPTVISKATLKPRAHEVSGDALIVKADGQTYLRFENLKTTNGPDLRIYLSSGLNNKDYVDLGAIKATDGNVNYLLPEGTDTTKYRYPLIWCRAFGVLFSYAEL